MYYFYFKCKEADSEYKYSVCLILGYVSIIWLKKLENYSENFEIVIL